MQYLSSLDRVIWLSRNFTAFGCRVKLGPRRLDLDFWVLGVGFGGSYCGGSLCGPFVGVVEEFGS